MKRSYHHPSVSRLLSIVIAAVLFIVVSAAAQTEHVIYSFQGGTDGASPAAGLVSDAKGNLYGTTTGYNYKGGTVFELTRPSGGGGWIENVLHTFPANSSDGIAPVAGVIFDKSGNLYGTTSAGGANGLGAVFELSPPASGSGPWPETILYSFEVIGNATTGDGASGLIFHGKSLIGVTVYGGLKGSGNIFELTPITGGGWSFHELYNFPGQPGGLEPQYAGDALIADKSGNLYGVTGFGGAHGAGTVFEFSPPAAGGSTWTQSILYSFQTANNDVQSPVAGVIFDANGNLYGPANAGGTFSYGGIFELSPPAAPGGAWTESVIYSFMGSTDGQIPWGNLSMDKSGNIYGTTLRQSAFELSPPSVSGGEWTETTLWDFPGSKNDGEQPESGLLLGSQGVLYGTTFLGGPLDFGTVYEVRSFWVVSNI